MCFKQNSHSFRVAHFRFFDDFRASQKASQRLLKRLILIIFAAQYCGLSDDLQAPFSRPEKSFKMGLKKGVFHATWEDVFSTSKRHLRVCWVNNNKRLYNNCSSNFGVYLKKTYSAENFLAQYTSATESMYR